MATAAASVGARDSPDEQSYDPSRVGRRWRGKQGERGADDAGRDRNSSPGQRHRRPQRDFEHAALRDCAQNVSRGGEILSLFVVRRPERSEKGDHAIHVLRHVGVTDGVIDRGALIQVGPQARAYALDMLAQEPAPGLRLGAIGFEHEVEADDRTADRLQLRLLVLNRPWLVQIKRLSTSDRSDATRPTTKSTMPFDS